MAGQRAPERYVPETNILKPADESLSNDEWPTFALTDAIVYRPDGVTMANALLINEEGPFLVRGRLEIEDEEDAQYLLKPNVRSANIQIDGSKSYSIGYDPQAVIWLSGKAGWFEINPHPSYSRIYRDMCEVTQLYYTLTEIYKEAGDRAPKNERKKALTSLDIKDILFEYAVAVGDGATYDETVDKCLRLGPALLAHLAIATDLPWKSTSFYKWLVKETKDKERSDRSSSRGASVPEAPSTSTPPSSLPPQPPSLPQQLPFRAPPTLGSDGLAVRESPVPLPPHASLLRTTTPAPSNTSLVPREERQAVFREYLKIVEGIGRELGNPSQLSVSKVHGRLYAGFRVKEYNTGKSLSAYFSKDLQESLSDAWRGGRYVKWLRSDEAKAFMPASDNFLRDIPGQLIRRTPNTHLSSASRTGSPAPSSTPSARPGLRTAGKRAALRLPMISRKRRFEGAFGEGGRNGHGDVDDSDATEGGDAAMSDGLSVAHSSPRPVGRPRKSAKNSHDYRLELESMHIDTNDSGNSAESSIDDDNDDDDDEDDGRKETLLAIHSEPLMLSTRPTGPNRTWKCPQAGCHYFVRNAGTPGASEDDSDDDDKSRSAARERIHAHLRTHEEEVFSRVDLAITEGSRGHVSVDHLLAKIRDLADKNSAKAHATGPSGPAVTAAAMPNPMVRRFLF